MKKILFVCLGNICRSPAAHGVMEKFITDNNLQNKFLVDSSGTNGLHNGQLPDPRMREHAKKRGYDLTHVSRQIKRKDLEIYDLILVMDDQNLSDVYDIDEKKIYRHKIFKIAKFANDAKITKVPDPYFGGAQGFELVLDILEQCCKNLLTELRNSHE